MFTAARIIGLLSLILIAVGTYLLYKGSPPGGGPSVFSNERVLAEIQRVRSRNQRLQRSGLALLLLAAALQTILLIFPTDTLLVRLDFD